MDKFQTFDTGNRKKFIDLAKKKKQETVTRVSAFVDQRLVIVLQANIRKFLSAIRTEQVVTDWNTQILKQPPSVVLEILKSTWDNNKTLFNRCHKLAIARAEIERLKIGINIKQVEKLQTGISEFAFSIAKIFDSLSKSQKKYWIQRILKHSLRFSLSSLSKQQEEHFFLVLTSSHAIFIDIIGTTPCFGLISELILLVTSRPAIRQKDCTQDEECELQSSLPLNRAYQQVLCLVANKSVEMLGPVPAFLLQSLSLMINALYSEAQLQLMRSCKIDPIYMKSEPELLEETLSEKQEWQCFLDYLNINSDFNKSVVVWYIRLQTFEESLQVGRFVWTVLKIMPMEVPIGVGLEDLLTCMKKISEWIRVHEISSSVDQQEVLLPLLYIINTQIFRMTDKQFVSFVKQEDDVVQKILRDKFIKIIYKVVLNQKGNVLIEEISKICILLVEEIYNRIFRTGVLSTDIFVNEIMSKKFMSYSLAKHDNEIAEFVKKFPFIFPMRDRARKFSEMIFLSHYNHYGGNGEDGASQVRIRRGFEFEDAFQALHKKNLRKGFRVIFINEFGEQERGIDAGGLTKELINRVLKAAFQPEFGLFIQNSEKQLLAHPEKAHKETGKYSQYYQFIGKMIGKALYQSITIGPKFCGPFLNAVIGKKNTFDDLRKIDKDLYQSLSYIKTMPEDAAELELTFQYRDQELKKYVNLKRDGSKIKVTNQNKQEYVSLLASYKVNKLLEFQSRHIRKGLKSMINSEWLFMFNYQELNYLISGSGEINIHDLRNYTRYSGYQDNDPTVKMFWSVVEEFSEEEKSALLMFVTACPRPSFLGFEELHPRFTIMRKEDPTTLPVSHTCSNILELPDYKDREVLKEKLKLAINNCVGFEIG